jgi:hypothetical protein
VRLVTVIPEDTSDFYIDRYIQISTREELQYVYRDQYEGLPFKIRNARFGHKNQVPNCVWTTHPMIKDGYNLELCVSITTSCELYVQPSWFDGVPRTIPIPVRCELFEQCREEMCRASTSYLRNHVLALAQGIPYRVREFREYFSANPDPKILTTLGSSNPEHNATKRDSRRAKAARRRQRKLVDADNSATTNDERGWGAIRQIAEALRSRRSLYDERFVEFLGRIIREYTDQLDFTDNSTLIQEMLSKRATSGDDPYVE